MKRGFKTPLSIYTVGAGIYMHDEWLHTKIKEINLKREEEYKKYIKEFLKKLFKIF